MRRPQNPCENKHPARLRPHGPPVAFRRRDRDRQRLGKPSQPESRIDLRNLRQPRIDDRRDTVDPSPSRFRDVVGPK